MTSTPNKIIFIAEAGVNHNGDIGKAFALIEAAAIAGADYVKFQTFKTELLVSRNAPKAEYQKKNMSGQEDGQFEMLKKLELSPEDHIRLKEHCKKCGIQFLSTAFDLESLDLLNSLGIDLYKIPSGEITNFTYLKKIASLGKPVVMSTGMADMHEIEEALILLQNEGVSKDEITVLHCNTEYPTPLADVNLKAMDHIRETFGVKVGYSDHTEGLQVSLAAAARGAVLIEKHFTLDKNLPGPDHKASLDPEELKQLVSGLRNLEILLGDGLKKPSSSEVKNKTAARKSLHFSKALQKGKILEESDFIALRPGSGISPMIIPQLIGKSLLIDAEAYQMVKAEDCQ